MAEILILGTKTYDIELETILKLKGYDYFLW